MLMEWKTPSNEMQKRFVCAACGFIAYENPKILVGCIATWGQKVLFMKRGTEPRKGYWSIPTGFMEKGETPEEAVIRELAEETHAELVPESLQLYLIGSIPEISEVYLVYRAELKAPTFAPTVEAASVKLFSESDIRSSETQYAYPETAGFLYSFCDEQKDDSFGVYSASYSSEIFTLNRICTRPQL